MVWEGSGGANPAAPIPIPSCRRAICFLLDINPTEYLADTLPRLSRGIVIARDLPALTPAAWKATREGLRTGHVPSAS